MVTGVFQETMIGYAPVDEMTGLERDEEKSEGHPKQVHTYKRSKIIIMFLPIFSMMLR